MKTPKQKFRMVRQYKLLGTLAIEKDDGQLSPVMKYKKGSALIAYLIVNGRNQSREVVADLLWDASSTNQSLRNLRAILFKIQPLIPELVVSRKQISFRTSEDIEIDYDALQATLNSEDLSVLDSGLALYKGDLLGDFYLDDSNRFNEWLLLERERLRREVWDGYRRLLSAYTEQEAWKSGIATALRWLALDDADEEILRHLMQLLATNGQVAAALQEFQSGRQRLWDELGVEPEPATVELATRLEALQAEIGDGLSWEAIVEAQVEFPKPGELAEPGPLPSQAYLPFHRNVAFTGRVEELLHLSELLLPPREGKPRLPRAVVITGMGGLGKTQLAVEYAYRYGRYYPGGVYWMSFANPDNIPDEVATIGGQRGMGLFKETDKLTQADQVASVQKAWQGQIPRLIIFDNCEDVNVAAEWLPVSGGCSVLLTSRFSDWSKTLPLTVYPLDILPRPESITFLQHLADEISDNEAYMVAQEVGDWPLALHLAGSFLYRYKNILPQEYVTQLRKERLLHHASLQGQYARYSPTGHELNVARTFALSFEQLDMADAVDVVARRLLAQVACLAPNEPIPLSLLINAASSTYAAVEQLQTGVGRLLSLGFLNMVEDNMVMIHHLLVTFALDWLADEPVLTDAKTAVEYSLIQQFNSHKETGGSLVALPFSPTHLRFLTNRALENDDDTTVQFASLMGDYLLAVASYQEARSYLEAALQSAEANYGENSLEMAQVATLMGNYYQATGHYKTAETYYQQALRIHEDKLGDNHVETANSFNNMGCSRLRVGPYPTAAPYLEKALIIRERLLGPEHPLTLGVLNNLGAMYNFMGEPDQARHYFEKVLAVRERTLGPDHLLTATTLNNLGDLLARNGEEAAGRPYLTRSTVIREKHLGMDHPLTLASKTNLGLLLGRMGDYEKAIEQLEQARTAALPKLGENHPLTARIFNTLGIQYTKTGRYEEALTYLEKALKIREKVRGSTHSDTAYSLASLGEMYLAQQDEAKARPLFERAMRILEQAVEQTDPDYLRIQAYLAEMP